ncbi:MAG: glycoside hydrolase family 5 protein [Bacillota bacterium]
MANPWRGQPRLVGFNLLNLFSLGYPVPETFDPAEFALIRDWGFNFVRLPLDHRFLAARGGGVQFDRLDPAVELGARYGLHVNINLHHAPGFCINTPPATWTLWTDPDTQESFIRLWEKIAERYRGAGVSYNLVNEATGSDMATYRELMRRTARAIYAVDPGAFIIIDGHDVGRTVVPDMSDLGLAQSVHCYDPMWLTHYKASWFYKQGDPYRHAPDYPGTEPPRHDGQPSSDERWDRERLRQLLAPWRELAQSGQMVHCGEFGVYSPAPREAALRWFADVVGLLKEMNVGWALWNLEGDFGVVNNRRDGGRIKRLFDGRLVDTELLCILQGSL